MLRSSRGSHRRIPVWHALRNYFWDRSTVAALLSYGILHVICYMVGLSWKETQLVTAGWSFGIFTMALWVMWRGYNYIQEMTKKGYLS